MCVFVCMHWYVSMNAGAWKAQASETMEMELQVGVGLLSWVLDPLCTCIKVASARNHGASLQSSLLSLTNSSSTFGIVGMGWGQA